LNEKRSRKALFFVIKFGGVKYILYLCTLNRKTMATKIFKIGEVCKGGIITVNTTKDSVTIIGKEWDYSKGSRRSSDQSNAKEFTRIEIKADESMAKRMALEFLQDLTTSYYADHILKWIETKVKLSTQGDGWHW
jgi:hypothetical protein